MLAAVITEMGYEPIPTADPEEAPMRRKAMKNQVAPRHEGRATPSVSRQTWPTAKADLYLQLSETTSPAERVLGMRHVLPDIESPVLLFWRSPSAPKESPSGTLRLQRYGG